MEIREKKDSVSIGQIDVGSGFIALMHSIADASGADRVPLQSPSQLPPHPQTGRRLKLRPFSLFR